MTGTIGEQLALAAETEHGVRFIDRAETETRLSYREVFERALGVAGGLLALGLRPRDRVAIVLPTSPEFLDAFFGAMLARLVPVPLFPPGRLGRLDEYHEQTALMLKACGARLVVTNRSIHRLLGLTIEGADPDLGCVRIEDLRRERISPLETDPDDVAFIQFSSGTTRAPKPVVLSHRQVLANVHAINSIISEAYPDDPERPHISVSWLPLYHDMGLIGCLVATISYPLDLVLIPPEDFVARPAVWLRTMARYRASLSAGPNFAYALCADRISDKELEGVDLSSWLVAFNGAEPVTPSVLKRFVDRFTPHGLRPETLTPVYGLAEATLAVTFAPLKAPFQYRSFDSRALIEEGRAVAAENGYELVSVGRPLPGFDVEIRDRDATALPDSYFGTVWVRGPSLMSGYHRLPQTTEAVLQDGWLNTGDTGFVYAGDLFLFGRAKDLIVLNGQNHSPHDIEHVIDEVPGVRRGCCAAVGIVQEGADGEQLVLLVERAKETPVDDEELVANIRSHVAEATGLIASEVRLLRPGTLPRSSSGKIRRAEASREFLADSLRPPAIVTKPYLAHQLAKSQIGYVRASRWAPFSRLVTRHPKLVLLIFASLILGAAVSTRDLRFHSSTETYADEDDPALIAFRKHQELFPAEDPVLIASIGKESVFDPGRLPRLVELHEQLEALPGVGSVWSIADTGFVRSVDNQIEIGQLIDELPDTAKEATRLRDEAMASPVVSRLLLSPDHRTALFVVEPETSGDPLARPAALVRALDEFREQYQEPDRLAIAGHPYTMTLVSQASREDVLVFAPLTAFVLSLLLISLYRSVWATIIPLAAAGSVSIIVMAVPALRGRPLSEFDGMLPTLFLAIGVAYSMHLLDAYARAEGSPLRRAKLALEKVALPVLISGATTTAGFFALITSGMNATKGFGVLGALGVSLMTIAVLTAVPAMLVLVGPQLSPARPGTPTTNALRILERWTKSHPIKIAVGFLLFAVVAVAGAGQIKVDTVFQQWFPRRHAARQDITAMQDAGIGTTLAYLTIDTGKTDGALQPDMLARLRRVSDRLEELPFVYSAVSLEPFLREYHDVASTSDRPPTRPQLAQYMLLYSSSDFASQIDELVDFDRRHLNLVLRTNVLHSSDWWPAKKQIIERIRDELPEATSVPSGGFLLMFEASDDIAIDQVRSLMTALMIIIVVLMIALRSARLGLLALPSNVIPILAVFAVIGWLGIPLDSVNSVIACMVLGIIVDDSVHFIVTYSTALRSGRDTDSAIASSFSIAGRPILFTTIGLTGSFLVFLASSFTGIFQVGLLAATAVIVALLADLLLLPVLLRWCAKAPRSGATSP